jgi:hypothetical protein
MSFTKASLSRVAGAVAMSALALGGCASKDYVDEQVGSVSSRVNELDRTSQEALARAKAAGKLKRVEIRWNSLSS